MVQAIPHQSGRQSNFSRAWLLPSFHAASSSSDHSTSHARQPSPDNVEDCEALTALSEGTRSAGLFEKTIDSLVSLERGCRAVDAGAPKETWPLG